MGRKFANDKEREKHQEAVKLRKMTDEQLTNMFRDTYVKGFNEGNTYKVKEVEKAKAKILSIRGLGDKANKINQIFEEVCDL